MGLGRLNIWVSDVSDPCGTWRGGGTVTVSDCKGVLEWPCGRFMTPDGAWQPVQNGIYKDLPFKCGHLEVELPPGCYWVVASYAGHQTPGAPWPPLAFNYMTHVGITQVGCDETACIKLFNPSLRFCWLGLHGGLQMLAAARGQDPRIQELESLAEELLRDAPRLPIERMLERAFEDLVDAAKQEGRGKPT